MDGKRAQKRPFREIDSEIERQLDSGSDLDSSNSSSDDTSWIQDSEVTSDNESFGISGDYHKSLEFSTENVNIDDVELGHKLRQTNLNNEWVKNVFSDLERALECAVCLEVVKKPFKLCARGHLVCVSCVKTLPSCPTCEGELLLENPVCIQKLLESLQQSCRYSADGCKAMVQDGDDHEKFCGFRRICCRKCRKNVLAKELFEHLSTVHSDMFIVKTANESWPVEYSGYKLKESGINYYMYLCVFDNVFEISLDNSDDEKIQISFQSIPVGNIKGIYYAKITFSKESIDYTYTLKAYPKIDEGKNNDRILENCMVVPKSMLPNFIDKRGALKFSVIVFKG